MDAAEQQAAKDEPMPEIDEEPEEEIGEEPQETNRKAGAKMRRLWHLAIPALISATSVADAADQIGVSVDTLQRWIVHPWFAARFQQAQEESLGFGLLGIQRAFNGAVKEMEYLSTCRSIPAPVRLAACVKLIEWNYKDIERRRRERKLAALEAALTGTDHGQRALGEGEEDEEDGYDGEDEGEDEEE